MRPTRSILVGDANNMSEGSGFAAVTSGFVANAMVGNRTSTHTTRNMVFIAHAMGDARAASVVVAYSRGWHLKVPDFVSLMGPECY